MEGRRGEKRPRDEHTWTEERCLICKTRSESYPVLHPGCHHPYCAECAMKKESKACDLCTKRWVRRPRSFAPSADVVIVAEFCDDYTACLSERIHVFETDSKNCVDHTRCLTKNFAKAHDEFMPFFYENGILYPKLFPARVAKHGARIGPGARVITYDDDDALVYNPNYESSVRDGSPDHVNAVYITKYHKYRLRYTSRTRMIFTCVSTPITYLSRVAEAFASESGLPVDDYVNRTMPDDCI